MAIAIRIECSLNQTNSNHCVALLLIASLILIGRLICVVLAKVIQSKILMEMGVLLYDYLQNTDSNYQTAWLAQWYPRRLEAFQ
jgi:hypothetical protein